MSKRVSTPILKAIAIEQQVVDEWHSAGTPPGQAALIADQAIGARNFARRVLSGEVRTPELEALAKIEFDEGGEPCPVCWEESTFDDDMNVYVFEHHPTCQLARSRAICGDPT